jgi:hypothetical protein
MEQPAVYDCIECASETRKVQRVDCQELDRNVPVLRFGVCFADSIGRSVNPPYIMTTIGEVQSVLSGAAAEVQNRTLKRALFFQSNDLTLGLADVPRRDAKVRRIETMHGSNVSIGNVKDNPYVRRRGAPQERTSTCPTESGFVFFMPANRHHRDGQRRRRFGAGVVTSRAPYLSRGTQSSRPEGPCTDSEGTVDRPHSRAEAAKKGETVLFPIRPNALRQVLDSLRDLEGKVIIDATNSVRPKAGEFGSVTDALRSWTAAVPSTIHHLRQTAGAPVLDMTSPELPVVFHFVPPR